MTRPQDADVLRVQSDRTVTVAVRILGSDCCHGCCLGVISCLRREAAEICVLLGCVAASDGNFLPTVE